MHIFYACTTPPHLRIGRLLPEECIIRKEKETTFDTRIGKVKEVLFVGKYGEKTASVSVESAYPHRIPAFTEPEGSKGNIVASKRVPYWQLNDNKDLHYRLRINHQFHCKKIVQG